MPNPFTLLLKLLLLILIPFLLLIRLAVYLHTSSNLLPWLCILTSILMTIILIFIYLSVIHSYVSDEHTNIYTLRRRIFISSVIVILYAVHGIFYLQSKNTKSDRVQSGILKVHPVLRLAASTLIHLDKDLMITDADRQPEDYKKMGLKSIKNSLHYKQSTGYTHALDLRTNNRPAWKNFLVEWYFKLMGFKTLRHHGTADHLHVSLMSHDRPWAR